MTGVRCNQDQGGSYATNNNKGARQVKLFIPVEGKRIPDQKITEDHPWVKVFRPWYGGVWIYDSCEEFNAHSAALKAEKKAKETSLHDSFNLEAEKRGYKKGVAVSFFAQSWFGLGGEVVTGKVARRGTGRYYVALDAAHNGKKTAPLNGSWKIA
jgi:hypothetical protein